jgi:hypothetical protein
MFFADGGQGFAVLGTAEPSRFDESITLFRDVARSVHQER